MNNAVIDPSGKVVNRSRNLAGIVRYLGGKDYATRVDVESRSEGGATLRITFASGNTYRTDFASKSVLMGWLHARRNLRGVTLASNGNVMGAIGALACNHEGEPIGTILTTAGGKILFKDCQHCGATLSTEYLTPTG